MKKNETKRNTSKRNLLLVALLLLVAVFTFGGYTLSKYISTQTSGEQSATVAKWGYTVTADASGLFGKGYTSTDGVSATIDESGVSVKASGDYNVVAPGTSGEVTFGIKGTAEVFSSVNVILTGNDIVLEISKDSTVDISYLPIEYKLSWGTTGSLSETEQYNTLSAVQEKITTVLKEQTNIDDDLCVNPNSSVDVQFKLEWKWAFDGNDSKVTGTNPSDSNKVTGDMCDTLLGRIANGESSTIDGYTIDKSVTKLDLNLRVSVEQKLNK